MTHYCFHLMQIQTTKSKRVDAAREPHREGSMVKTSGHWPITGVPPIVSLSQSRCYQSDYEPWYSSIGEMYGSRLWQVL